MNRLIPIFKIVAQLTIEEQLVICEEIYKNIHDAGKKTRPLTNTTWSELLNLASNRQTMEIFNKDRKALAYFQRALIDLERRKHRMTQSDYEQKRNYYETQQKLLETAIDEREQII